MTDDRSEVLLNNGLRLPSIGFGVFQSSPDDTREAVATALNVGYRHVDTAAMYGNEQQVGEAVRDSGLSRDEIVVESKVWVSDYGFDETLHAFAKATRKLGSAPDVLILHQPAPDRFRRTIQSYKALEKLYRDGEVRAIGVSNFMPHHLTALLNAVEIVPALNQIELHPYFQQPDVRAMNAKFGVLDQAWSPIGGITFYRPEPGLGGGVMVDPALVAIAEAHGKTPAQVMLRWHVQEGRQAIPKSINPVRIAENFDVRNFCLSDGDLAILRGLDTGVRGGPDPDGADTSRFERPIPEA